MGTERQGDKALQMPWSAVCSALVAMVVILGLFTIHPRYGELQPYRVAEQSVQVLPHEGLQPTRRLRVGETEYDLRSARSLPSHMRQQFRIITDIDRVPTSPGQVYLPVIVGTSTLFMNGVRLRADSRSGPHLPGLSNRYLLATVPADNYQVGINRLTIVMSPDRSRVGVPAIFTFGGGAMQDVLPRHSQARGLLVARAERAAFAGSLFLLAVAAIGALLRVRIGIYSALGVIGLSGLLLRGAARGMSDRSALLEFGSAGLLYASIAVCLVFVLRRSNVRQNPVMFGLWIAAILSTLLSALLLLPISKPPVANALPSIVLLGYLPAAIAAGVAALWQDQARYRDIQQDLSRQIEQQQNVIFAQQAAIEEGLKAKGRLEERQRLTRDIHDGIGGHLLSMLVRVRGGDMSADEIEDDLQSGINDLRLIVDSMDHSDGSLQAALVTFRARAEAQLRVAGIALDWQQSTDLSDTEFGPEAILNIYRLLQEALTNAIRHAQCRRIEISLFSDDARLRIFVSDDGVGMNSNGSPKAGQGLRNMTYRARQLGATLEVGDAPHGGTQIGLSFALPSGAS